MRDIALIATISIRNNLRMKIAVFILIGVAIICLAGIVLSFSILLIAPAMKAAVPDRSALNLYLSIIVYSASLIGVGVNMNTFAFQTMTREKARGNIESLLATPLELTHVWIAKSLAVFLPGLLLGECFALIALLAVNFVYFVPVTGFLITPWMVISSFVTVPLIYLCLSLLVHLIGLTGKPATGNIIVQIFLPVFVSLMINLALRNILDPASWSFILINVGIAISAGAIIILLKPRLSKERIILSG